MPFSSLKQAQGADLYEVAVTTPKATVGERMWDELGNEYIYLQGVASTVAGVSVTFDELGVTALTVADARGPVAFAMAASDAVTKFGWYQIYGSATALSAGAVVDNANVYVTATAGRIDDAIVAGDRLKRAIARSAPASATTMIVQIFYPFLDDGAAA